jgi:hypothetical protein
MRINGTIFERILYGNLLLFVFVTVFILIVCGGIKSIETIIMMSLFMSTILIILILVDIIKIKRNLKLSKSIINNKNLYIDKLFINSEDIISIKPIHISHYRWSLNIIEIKTENEVYHLLDKPLMFWELLNNKKSRSIKIIENNISDLKNKILERETIYNKFPIRNRKNCS